MNDLFIAVNGKPVRVKGIQDLHDLINEYVEIDMYDVAKFLVENINDVRREVSEFE